MVIDGAWKNKVFRLWEEENKSLVKKEIFRYRMKCYDNLERVEDKIFIDYRMAYLEYLDKNIEIANKYFKNLELIYSDDYTRESCEYEYYKYKWLYINANSDYLNKEETISGMMEVCNYYSNNGNEKMMKMAYGNILKFKEDEKELLKTLEYILQNDKYLKINFLNSILKDCEEISSNLYIKALDMISEYKINIKVV